MASVRLTNINKAYPPAVKALQSVDLEIPSGEFFTLLGPSGCGKTTLLRTLAGFVVQDDGSIRIDDRPVDHIPAYRRDIGMVFQDYAIFPHMSVADNVAFGLRNRKVGRTETEERVRRALGTARLAGFEERMPSQLSGGQQQRVGLARAMVIEPQVLLMDEPLSNLDAKLRIELREDIRDIQQELGITTIYVTHDQEEALVISDRICIMDGGVVQQVGPPWEIYKQPRTHFVAAFVGAMNFLSGALGGGSHEDQAVLSLGGSSLAVSVPSGSAGPVAVAIRPEDVAIVGGNGQLDGAEAFLLEGSVSKITFTGREAQYLVTCGDGVTAAVHIDRPTPELLAQHGQSVKLALPREKLLLFDAETRQAVR